MPTLYGVPGSPFVRKVRVVLDEKRIPYDLEPVIPVNVSPEYRDISPLGKVPAFRDGERTLADSSVIAAYLDRLHPEPSIYPSDPYQYARALWFEEYGDTAMAELLTGVIFLERFLAPRVFGRETNEAAVRDALENRLPPRFDYLESQLGAGEFLAGSFSVGDVAVVTHFVGARMTGFEVDAQRWPALARYVTRVVARPSFRKLIEEETSAIGQAA